MKPDSISTMLFRLASLCGCCILVAITSPSAAQDESPDLSSLLFELAPANDTDTTIGSAIVKQAEDESPDTREALIISEQALLQDISRYEDAVLAMEVTTGPYSRELFQQLRTLGTLYEESGNFQAAITTYEKAMHVVRVNDGLHTLEQEPLVRDIIRNYELMGNFEEVDKRREYLYFIHQKNYSSDDPGMLEAMEEWADWNVLAYYRQDYGQANTPFVIQNTTGISRTDYIPVYGPGNTVTYVPRSQAFNPNYGITNSYLQAGGPSANTHILQEPRLRTARDLYEAIGEALGETEGTTDTALLQNERKLANIAYIVKQQSDLLEDQLTSSNLFSNRVFQSRQPSPLVSRGYINSRDSLETRIEQMQASATAGPLEVAEAMLDLADWHLSFDRSQRAFSIYQEIHDHLLAEGYSETAIDGLMAPAPLVQIPTFATHPFTRSIYGIDPGQELDYRGYIDLELTLDRYGNTKGVDVLQTSENTPFEVRRALLERVRTAKMRPQLVAGETITREDLQVRYYYHY
ncbi:MAG: tetratricopeptide repeat protein [Pseudohongiellaceae bacterium]